MYLKCKGVTNVDLVLDKEERGESDRGRKKFSLNNLEFIDFDNFKNIELCSNTTCGGKVMCMKVEYNDKIYVLKEGRDSMNNNLDYCVVDECKEIFGLNKIGMRLIKSNKIVKK